MEDMLKVMAVALVMVVFLTFLRSTSQTTFATQVSLGFVILMLIFLMGPIRQVLDVFLELGRKAEIKPAYTSIVMRAIGIGYVASFGAQLAKDAKEDSIANVIEMIGKVLILLLAVPVVSGIMEALVGLLP